MKARETFENLVMGEFPKNLLKNVYPSNPNQSVYVSAMDEVCEPNRDLEKGKTDSPEKNYFRHDVIFVLNPGKKERKYGSGFDYHYHVLSIEIKCSLLDLLKDENITQYLGATHYCFLAGPKNMLSNGIRKIRSFEESGRYVGLINSNNGDIVIMPESQEEIHVRERQDRLLANMYNNPKRYDNPSKEYRTHKYFTGQTADSFEEKAGLLLNRKYNKHLK